MLTVGRELDAVDDTGLRSPQFDALDLAIDSRAVLLFAFVVGVRSVPVRLMAVGVLS